VGVLPVAFFCSGHVYFTQQMHKTLGIEPYAVHATFQFSGTPGKRHRFRDAGLWWEDDQYFHPPGGWMGACVWGGGWVLDGVCVCGGRQAGGVRSDCVGLFDTTT